MSTIFTDGTLYVSDKLEMINSCLLAIGEMPLLQGTLIEDIQLGSDADIARRIVEETMIEVQNRGWYFNTDYNYELLPVNNFITMPPNTLRVDFGNTSRGDYIMVGKRIYDIKDKTFYIKDNKLYADVIWLKDYEELPTAAYAYISLRAARKFQQRVIGSNELAGFTQIDEQDALINMQREHMQYQDYNLREDRMRRRTSMFLKGNLYGN